MAREATPVAGRANAATERIILANEEGERERAKARQRSGGDGKDGRECDALMGKAEY